MKNKFDFILLTSQRSGSTFLSSLLKSHKDVCFLGEIYIIHAARNKKEGHDIVLYEEFLSSLLGRVCFKLSPFLANKVFLGLFFLKKRNSKSIKGFKLMISHFHYRKETNKLLQSSKVIKLYRRNLLDQFISLRVAEENKNWISSKKKNQPISIRTDTLISSLDKIKIRNDNIASIKADKGEYTCFYEDLIDPKKRREILIEIQEFLGLPVQELVVGTKKQINSKQSVVSNFDEIVTELKGTKYEYCINE